MRAWVFDHKLLRMRMLTILFVAALFSLSACGDQNAAAVGTWKFDFETTAEAMKPDLERVARGPAREKLREDAIKFLKGQVGALEISLQLKADGSAESTRTGRGPERKWVGEWRFDGKKQEVVVSGGGNTERYRLQDDTLRFLVPVTETGEAEKRTVELVLKRES